MLQIVLRYSYILKTTFQNDLHRHLSKRQQYIKHMKLQWGSTAKSTDNKYTRQINIFYLTVTPWSLFYIKIGKKYTKQTPHSGV